MKAKPKKRNMQDATLLNVRHLKKRVDALEVLSKELVQAVLELLSEKKKK